MSLLRFMRLPGKRRYWFALVAVIGAASYFAVPRPEYLGKLIREAGRGPAQSAPRVPGSSESTSSAPTPICENFYELICRQQTGTTRDPTGTVRPDLEGELEALRIYQDLTREHPEWSPQEVDEALAQAIYTPKRRQRVEAAFRWTLQAILKLISRESAFSSANKKLLRQKLRSVHLELPPPAAIYADEPDLLTKNDVVYERLSNGVVRLRVGGAFLFTSKSWFNMVFTFAHELGHSIDPCEISETGGSIPVYRKLESCFVDQRWMKSPGAHRICSQNDQLSETFADWLAVRITAETLKEYATEFSRPQIIAAAVNSVRDLCEQDQSIDETDTREHPSPAQRIDMIFGGSPEIRTVLGCRPAPKPGPAARVDVEFKRENYCDL